MTEFEKGLLIGVLIGEGHFGGDGKQPHVTVRMHSRNEALFSWLLEVVPGSRLYGPYHHGGRDYCQWMARGTALKYLLSVLDEVSFSHISPPTYSRYTKMKENYNL
ncbi:MAG: hypothetical protein U1D96_01485 [Eubacteriales bacterium]|jgi:hypothetical protein|nr:hypothetical protein [Bacillota bacterium]MBV1727920.1 hypothetical protein [Desulforudis sp.]MDZ4042157.1 hypothetical protein [Eubacteriales bacterium]MBU4534117.1 hypothetical protein [Bacillota bacterium]MBU4553363.1 hypothetical protein [Bacillota bacterium]